MLLKDFKNTVNSFSANINPDDLLAVCENLKIDTKLGYSRNKITDKLYTNIKESLSINKDCKDKISKTKLLNLQSELIYRYVLYDEDPVEYLKILKVINDSCRPDVNYFPLFSEKEKWRKAIINSKNFNLFSPNIHSILFDNLRDDYPKEFDRAISVKKLIEKCCRFEIRDSNIIITSGIEGVIDELENKIKIIGGIFLIKSIFNQFEKEGRYSKRFERFFITRQASGISYDQKPQIPYGYLLNLSLKYPFENLKVKNVQKLLNEIVNLSVLITNGAYGVQYYNFWEYHFQSGETIIKFLTDIALWDSIFSIPQSHPTTSLETVEELVSIIKNSDFEKYLGFTKKDFFSVSKQIIKIVANTNIPTIIYLSKVCKELKNIDKSKIHSILEHLAHSETVNKDYKLPSDYFHINFFLKPLIKIGNTKYLLINKSWSAPNYFEAIISALRDSISNLDSKIGYELEALLQNKLRKKGISSSTGEYRVNGIDGEADLVIESNKAIILIEFKKKVLTRKSKSGIDINILIDLVDSLLTAQIQAGRTEILLKKNKSITLKDKNNNISIINLNNRKIERIALTQLEFGGFQDRTIIIQFFKSFITHTFGTYSKDKSIIKKFKKLEEKQKIWIEQYTTLCKLDEDFSHFPFFNCWFLSLPQIIEIINMSNNNDTFYEVLTKTKSVSMNTLDWYREFDYVTNNLKK